MCEGSLRPEAQTIANSFALPCCEQESAVIVPLLPVGKRQECGAKVDDSVNPLPSRPPNPIFLFTLTAFAQLNTRRVRSSAEEVHSGFRGLVDVVSHSSVGVVCVQQTHAPQFPCFPDNQLHQHDGPDDAHGREAGFLFHEAVPATRVPGRIDSFRIRLRLVTKSVCGCSYYAPHADSDDSKRIHCWRDLRASVRLVTHVFPEHPLVVSVAAPRPSTIL